MNLTNTAPHSLTHSLTHSHTHTHLLEHAVEVLAASHGDECVGVGEVGHHSNLVAVLEATTDSHDCRGDCKEEGEGRNGKGDLEWLSELREIIVSE